MCYWWLLVKLEMPSHFKGKFIVIDGIDGSGKATQVKLLAERLENAGYKIKTIDFPRYQDNFFGQFIGQCLAGKHGDFLKLDPYITSVVYAADRFESSQMIAQWLAAGYFVLADRYVSANQIHQGSKLANDQDRDEFIAWLEQMEYGVFHLPKPDRTFFLQMELDVSRQLILEKNKLHKNQFLKGKVDQYEKSAEHQKLALQTARVLAEKNGWEVIDCSENGQLMTKEKICDMIWDKLGY